MTPQKRTAQLSAYHRAWRQNNREHVNAVARARYLKNRDKLLARATVRRAENLVALREKGRAWRANNPEATRRYYLKDPARRLWRLARTRAKKAGLHFNIEEAGGVIPAVCPVLGLPLAIGVGTGFRDCSPTLDRVDNTRGYVKGNVAVISWRANRLKSDATPADLVAILKYIKART